MNPSKRKGTQFETDVVLYLREHGFPYADRQPLRGSNDKGDIAGIPLWTLEAKATREISLASAVDEATRESVNANTPNFAAIIKRRNKSVDSAYVVLPLWLWTSLVRKDSACLE